MAAGMHGPVAPKLWLCDRWPLGKENKSELRVRNPGFSLSSDPNQGRREAIAWLSCADRGCSFSQT